MTTKQTFKRKPKKCPECKSNRIASILYGMPAYTDQLEEDLRLGKVILGGCEVTLNDPKWQCADCGIELFKYCEIEIFD